MPATERRAEQIRDRGGDDAVVERNPTSTGAFEYKPAEDLSSVVNRKDRAVLDDESREAVAVVGAIHGAPEVEGERRSRGRAEREHCSFHRKAGAQLGCDPSDHLRLVDIGS